MAEPMECVGPADLALSIGSAITIHTFSPEAALPSTNPVFITFYFRVVSDVEGK
jgi:hypothetical protein